MAKQIATLNKLVAVEPFPAKTLKQTVMKGGLIGVAQKVELLGLKVILQSEDRRFFPGDTVYVKGDLSSQDFTSNVQEIEGKTFVLIPDSYIQLLVESDDAVRYFK